jgi:hypothetical protein
MVRLILFIFGLILAFGAFVWSLQAPDHSWLVALILGSSLWYLLDPDSMSGFPIGGHSMRFWWSDEGTPEQWELLLAIRDRSAVWYRANRLPKFPTASMLLEYSILLLILSFVPILIWLSIDQSNLALTIGKIILVVLLTLGVLYGGVLFLRNNQNREKALKELIDALGGPFVITETIYRHCGTPNFYRLSWASKLFLPGSGVIIKLCWGRWVAAFDLIAAYGLIIIFIECLRWLKLRWQDTENPKNYSPCKFYPLAVLATLSEKERDNRHGGIG